MGCMLASGGPEDIMALAGDGPRDPPHPMGPPEGCLGLMNLGSTMACICCWAWSILSWSDLIIWSNMARCWSMWGLSGPIWGGIGGPAM